MLVLRWVLGVVRGSSFAAFLSSLMVIYVIMFWSLIGFWLTFLGKKKLRVLFLISFGFLGSKNFVILTIWIWSFLEFNWICVIYFYFLKKRNEDLSTGGLLVFQLYFGVSGGPSDLGFLPWRTVHPSCPFDIFQWIIVFVIFFKTKKKIFLKVGFLRRFSMVKRDFL